MNDKELLELAAKAVGITLQSEPYSLGGVRYFHREDDYPSGTTWNPLTDDGDALRLAVNLGMNVAVNFTNTCAETAIDPGVIEQHGSDKYAATRRAIVCAAAQRWLDKKKYANHALEEKLRSTE